LHEISTCNRLLVSRPCLLPQPRPDTVP
jgi:hypothetical protein